MSKTDMMKQPTTLADILNSAAERYGDMPALTMPINYRTFSLSYGETLARAACVAQCLRAYGIGKGDPVLIFSPNSPHMVVALWGIFLNGSVAVPLNIQSTSEMVEAIQTETKARLLFTHARALTFDIKGVTELTVDHAADPVDDTTHSPHSSDVSLSEDDVAQIMYTSGTTGMPKGVVLTHKNMLTAIRAVQTQVLVDADDTILSILPLSHIYEQIVGLFVPFSAGAHIVYLDRPSSLLPLMREYRVTKMAAVPEFLSVLMEKIEYTAATQGKKESLERLFVLAKQLPMFVRRFLARKVLASFGGKLALVASGGAPLSKTVEKKWNALGICLLQGYGLTEVAGVATMNTIDEHKPVSVGKPIPDLLVRIAKDGEVLMKGPSVFSGYLHNSEATADAIDEEGWFHTGDIGEYDADGYLYLKGRKKYMILGPGGQNVYPEDIEETLNGLPSVNSSCVIGIDEGAGVRIYAMVVRTDREVHPDDIMRQANQHLASYQTISTVLVWDGDDFPRSASRKVKRDDVRRWLLKHLSGKVQEGSSTSGGSKLQQLIASVAGGIPEEIKDTSVLGTDLALDSLMRVELLARIEREYGVAVDELSVTGKTTVSDLRALILSASPITARNPFVTWPLTPIAHVLRTYVALPLSLLVVSLFVRVEPKGLEHLEIINEPCLIMPNHVSMVDSGVIARALPRTMRRKLSHAAGEDTILFTVLRHVLWFFRLSFNVFALPRTEGSRISDGLAYVGWMLDHGYSVVIFPEGRMRDSNNLLPIQPGAGLLATQMRVPVVPVYLDGLDQVLKPKTLHIRGIQKKVVVAFGEPLYFSETDTLNDAQTRIAHALQELQQTYEGSAPS